MGNAQGNVYGEEASTLTFTKCQSGMSLHLYRVADGKFGSYKYTKAFLDAKNANININKLQTSEEAQIAATTLMGYAVNKEDSHFIASGDKVRVEGLSAGLYLLVIDDLASERRTEYMDEMVTNVIDSRYRNGKPVIITTNLTADEMVYSEDVNRQRIYSRLYEMCVFYEVKGDDRRKSKQKDFKNILEELKK